MAPRNGPERAEATELSRSPDIDPPVGVDASVLDVMATMRAMRRLKPDPVPREVLTELVDRKSTRLNSSHIQKSRMPSSA